MPNYESKNQGRDIENMSSPRMTFFACEAAEGRLSRASQPNGWRKYRITPELKAVGLEMIRLFPSQVAMGMVDSSPKPCGKPKHFWVMRLRMLPGRNRLPRGFSKLPFLV